MRRAIGWIALALVAGLALLWESGALAGLARALEGAQRGAQQHLAGAIRALRGGEPGALLLFWGLCFGYGVVHAAGPGHGKLLIGGYGVARRVPMVPLAGLALLSSLAQAAAAVAAVYGALALFGLSRQGVEGAAERWMTPASHAMVAGLGLWLVWRGLRGLRGAGGQHDHDHHGHGHGHGHGPGCGHAHGPTAGDMARLTGWRDAAALVAGIALRPCAGALFVLILTWQLGIGMAGVVGAFVMGLGTAVVTVAAAGIAVGAREGALAGLGGGTVARVLPVVELAVGGIIAIAALGLLAGGV